MPILKIPVENPDDLLNASFLGAGALIRWERSATGGGAGFAEIGTVALVAGTRIYTVYDSAGAVGSWYRVRYSKSNGSSPTSYSDEWQSGSDETGGLICSLDDVKQELGQTATTDDEMLLEKIRQVGAEINFVTGRLFTRTPASGTTTYLFDVDEYSTELVIPKGIAQATTLEVATTSQPESGGTYAMVASADWFLRPVTAEREFGWPATRICLSNTSSSRFYPGYNVVRVTMALGWDKVPADIQAIALRAVVGSYSSKSSPTGITGPSGATFMLRNVSPEDREKLDRYTLIPA
jgi:hypothetical protein